MTAQPYPTIDANPNFAKLEEEVLAFWQAEGVFKQSINQRAGAADYVFYDGPPFANGLPHYGHLLTGYVKDAVARYHTMRGKRVERRFGWDCHGLPAEMGAEKELGISGRAAIAQYGIGKFNEHCRTSVMKYTADWEYYVNRQGRWVDFDNDYKTMDTPFMESCLWAFKELWNKGLIYESMRVMPYSWAAETPVSNFETRMDNATRPREDLSAYVKFRLTQESVEKLRAQGVPEAKNYYLIAWTTTPWTLPSNLALAVNAGMKYACVTKNGIAHIAAFNGDDAGAMIKVAKELGLEFVRRHSTLRGEVLSYFDGKYITEKNIPKDKVQIEDNTSDLYEIKGSDLIGLTYEPLFPYFAGTPNAFRVLDGSEFVTDGDGTGVVHMAPGFGEVDQQCCVDNGIEVIVPVDEKGRFTDAMFDVPWVQEPSPARGGSNLLSQIRGGVGTQEDSTRKPESLARAQEMRKNPTDAEKKLWAALSDEKLQGKKFRRQHAIGNYIVDFVCTSANLIIELDGGQHSEQTAYDTARTAYLETQHYRVLRFWNHEVMQNLEGVLAMITEALMHPPESASALSTPRERGMMLSLKGLTVVTDTRIAEADIVVSEEDKAQHIAAKDVAKYGLANMRIVRWLKANGKLVKTEPYTHNYPHCWRTDTPLIYRAMSSWYVNVQKIKANMVENNQTIHWIPGHVQAGQMGKGIETAPDWSISRNRFWGTPIPIWKSASGKIHVCGSIEEIEKLSGQKVTDLHRPYIDEVVLKIDGEEYTRIEDVFDCWFESGSMPFAQLHYPFENKQQFEKNFPADFITEYIAQTRGWFYTLQVLSAALFGKAPFKNVICHGVVIDEETGLKYSKRLKNYRDPKEVMDEYGADALRWMMLSSPVMRGSDLGVDPEGKFIRDVVRLNIKPMWSAYYFFTLYANADGVVAKEISTSDNMLDAYILAKCKAAVLQVRESLDAYDTPGATEAITSFFEVLNNWYIRRSRARFWGAGVSADKQAAFDTLFTVLTLMCRAAAPLLPFTTEAIYRGLHASFPPESASTFDPPQAGDKKGEGAGNKDAEPSPVYGGSQSVAMRGGNISVHLTDFPDVSAMGVGDVPEGLSQEELNYIGESAAEREWHLLEGMDKVRDICNAGLSIRNEENIRVRQPLSSVTIYAKEQYVLDRIEPFFDIIKDEMNVKNVVRSSDLEKQAEYKIKLDFSRIGKRIGSKMKQIAADAKAGNWKFITYDNQDVDAQRSATLMFANVLVGQEKLDADEFKVTLEAKNKKGTAPLSTNDALVILDLTITPELEAEGTARDLVRMVQQARKDAGLQVSDRIDLSLAVPASFASALKLFGDYIAEQTLATSLIQTPLAAHSFTTTQEVEGEAVTIQLAKAA